MQIETHIQLVRPFDVSETDPFVVVDHEGSEVCKTTHFFITELVATALNNVEPRFLRMAESHRAA